MRDKNRTQRRTGGAVCCWVFINIEFECVNISKACLLELMQEEPWLIGQTIV